MMIVRSKQYTKAYRELESELKCLIHNFAYDRGLYCYFIEDSEIIQRSIGNISARIASLLEETYLIKYQIGSKKAFEEATKPTPKYKISKSYKKKGARK